MGKTCRKQENEKRAIEKYGFKTHALKQEENKNTSLGNRTPEFGMDSLGSE